LAAVGAESAVRVNLDISDTATALKVRSWRPLVRHTLLGFLSLELPSGLVINDITVHEKAGSRWCSMPARQYEKDGEKQWAPLVDFANKETREAFQRLALEALDAHLGSGASDKW
jgi:DNA-binding cell septation regulator SpoVG